MKIIVGNYYTIINDFHNEYYGDMVVKVAHHSKSNSHLYRCIISRSPSSETAANWPIGLPVLFYDRELKPYIKLDDDTDKCFGEILLNI